MQATVERVTTPEDDEPDSLLVVMGLRRNAFPRRSTGKKTKAPPAPDAEPTPFPAARSEVTVNIGTTIISGTTKTMEDYADTLLGIDESLRENDEARVADQIHVLGLSDAAIAAVSNSEVLALAGQSS